jgi:hypothetical protein
MVYVDKPAYYLNGDIYCFLWCDPGSEEDLHTIAEKLGLKKKTFQENETFPRYDILDTKRERAVKAGAHPFILKDWFKKT